MKADSRCRRLEVRQLALPLTRILIIIGRREKFTFCASPVSQARISKSRAEGPIHISLGQRPRLKGMAVN